MLGSDDDEHRALAVNRIGAWVGHAAGESGQQAIAAGAAVVIEVVRALTGHDGHDRVGGREAALDVIGRPGVLFLVLAEAEGELGGVALGRAVHFARLGTGHVQQYQAERAADRGIGLAALAEAVGAAVDVEFVADRAAYHDHRRAGMRSRERAVQVEFRLEHASQRGGHDRKVFRLAACHHGVGGHRLDGRYDLARRYGRVGAIVAAHRRDELRHLRLGRHEERHAVAPALLRGELVERLDIHVADVDDFLFGDIRHVFVASRRPWVAVSIRSRSSSALRPPTGCFTTISLGSILRAFAWASTRGLKVSVAIT